jgi:multidrug transporter EmrE-like cation transporter
MHTHNRHYSVEDAFFARCSRAKRILLACVVAASAAAIAVQALSLAINSVTCGCGIWRCFGVAVVQVIGVVTPDSMNPTVLYAWQRQILNLVLAHISVRR